VKLEQNLIPFLPPPTVGYGHTKWVVSTSDRKDHLNNRRAKYYGLTKAGRGKLKEEARTWHSYSDAVGKALAEETR